MKKIVLLIITISLLFVPMTFAGSKLFLSSGTTIYYFTHQTAVAGSSQMSQPTQTVLSEDAPVVEVISTDPTLGLAQVQVKLMQNSLPVLVWARIVDLKNYNEGPKEFK